MPALASQSKRWRLATAIALGLAAPVTIVLLVVLVSDGNRHLLQFVHDLRLFHERPHRVGASLPEDLLVFFGLLAVGAGLGRIISINQFSLHGMYRSRLVRTFLGVSRPRTERRPSAFTGFDAGDDMPFEQVREVGRPLHVVNTTLNLVADAKLSVAERKAMSFTMSPLHVGSARLGYRPAAGYADAITLGEALTTSGAAVNSNMGPEVSRAMTFLLTVFNARLGVWLGNPGHAGDATWRRAAPAFGVAPLVNELMAQTTDHNPYVLLSDGGHFDNLGLYEMIRRRCRYIVLSDAGCDGTYAFADLANAVRKIRIDFGIDIVFPHGLRIGPPRPDADRRRACRHRALRRRGDSILGDRSRAQGWRAPLPEADAPRRRAGRRRQLRPDARIVPAPVDDRAMVRRGAVRKLPHARIADGGGGERRRAICDREGVLPLGAARTTMTMRKVVLAAGIFLAGIVGGWMLSSGIRSRDMREAAPLAALPQAAGQNGLTDADRGSFYHLSEGGELFPLDWLLALDVEVPASDGSVHVRPFLDNIERFGLLPDAKNAANPYGLPVGISLAPSKLTGTQMIGLNCAACHVGQVQYQNHAVRVDGAGNMAYINKFLEHMASETEATFTSPQRLSRFWDRVRAVRRERRATAQRDPADVADDETLARRFAHLLTSNRGLLEAQVRALRNVPTLKRSLEISTDEGYGRLDAFGIGRDELFGTIAGNSLPADGPVSIPHIWGLEYTGWLQWGANTNSVMERNIGQALGVGALFDPKTFESTVRIDNLHTLETLAYKITPPAWPDTFPPIDAARAERGRALFYQNCAGCHETFKTDGKMRIYQLFSLDEVGTDPMTAINYERQVKLADGTVQAFPTAALGLISRVKAKAYQEKKLDRPDDRAMGAAANPERAAVGPDVPRAAARRRSVGGHPRPQDLSLEDAGRHLGDGAVPPQRLGSHPLRPAPARRQAPGKLSDRPARIRSDQARHPDRSRKVFPAARTPGVPDGYAAPRQLEHRPRVVVLPHPDR